MVTYVGDDSYRTDRAVLPLDVYEGRAGAVGVGVKPGDLVKVDTLRQDDHTGFLKPGDVGVVIYADRDRLIGLWGNSEKSRVLQLVGGDRVLKVDTNDMLSEALEVWHEDQMSSAGRKLYLHVPLPDEGALYELLNLVQDATLVKERYRGVVSFSLRKAPSRAVCTLDVKQALELTVELCQKFSGA